MKGGLKERSRTRGMAESFKCLLHMHGDLCPTFKKLGVMECVCNLWGLLAHQPSPTSKLQTSNGPSIRSMMDRWISVHTCICTYLSTHRGRIAHLRQTRGINIQLFLVVTVF